jgi:hypothetical protein
MGQEGVVGARLYRTPRAVIRSSDFIMGTGTMEEGRQILV